MTRFDYYRVTLREFMNHVEVEMHHFTKKGYTPVQVTAFSMLTTEIHYLTIHYNHLREKRLSGDVVLNLKRDGMVGMKLKEKQNLYKEYLRWLT